MSPTVAALGQGPWACANGSPIVNRIANHQSNNPAIPNPQSTNPQSAIRTHQSSISNEKARFIDDEAGFENTPGSDLLSHAVSHAVPSAVESLTSVFGMGTGVTPLR
jgi:cell pole-organizing protein PopZ